MGETIGPPLWPHKPGEITIRRNGYGHYSVIIDAKQVATVCGASDFQCRPLADAVADYARCREVTDAVAENEAQRAAILRDLPPLPTGDRFSAELTGLDPDRPPTAPSPCRSAELSAEDRAVLAWLSGNPEWADPGVLA